MNVVVASAGRRWLLAVSSRPAQYLACTRNYSYQSYPMKIHGQHLSGMADMCQIVANACQWHFLGALPHRRHRTPRLPAQAVWTLPPARLRCVQRKTMKVAGDDDPMCGVPAALVPDHDDVHVTRHSSLRQCTRGPAPRHSSWRSDQPFQRVASKLWHMMLRCWR
jgi:hypothetical protein